MGDDGVEVVTRAQGDVRFLRLAQLCGLADADHALGRMVRLWSACKTLRTHVLAEDLVVSVLGPGAVESLVVAELGEKILSGGVRMRGAAELIRFRARKSAPGERAPTSRDRRTQSWTEGEQEIAARVLGKLSERSGYAYRTDAATYVRPIVRLLREGASERDLQRVVWHRCQAWKDNVEMEMYLRPATLFGPTNFANYLPQADAEVERLQREQADRDRPREAMPALMKGEG